MGGYRGGGKLADEKGSVFWRLAGAVSLTTDKLHIACWGRKKNISGIKRVAVISANAASASP